MKSHNNAKSGDPMANEKSPEKYHLRIDKQLPGQIFG
jgi:hypothetical protein